MGKLGVWLAPCAVFCALAQPLPTAVYTLADHHTSRWTPEPDPLLKVAGVCQIAPSGPSFTLACAAAPAREVRAGRRHFYTIALFSDLEQTLYMAVCSRQYAEDPCEGLKAGETFSAEVEDRTIRVVFRGELLPMRILEKRPKPVTIDSPTRGTPSGVRPSAGSPSRVPYSQVAESRGTPSTARPSEVAVAAGAPSLGAPSAVKPAVASPTGARLIVHCPNDDARVYVDGQPVGQGSAEVPLRPGRHTVLVRRAGYRNWAQTVDISPGATVRVTAELRR